MCPAPWNLALDPPTDCTPVFNGVAQKMATAPFGTCPAMKILTPTPCGSALLPGRAVCPRHEGTDSERRCQGDARGARGDRVGCWAWPLAGLPYCRAHDPQRKELRRQARAAGDAQVARVRASVSTASAEVLGRVLDLLVVGRKVRAADVEAAFGKYQMRTDRPVQ
jgi:hypothetical protein